MRVRRFGGKCDDMPKRFLCRFACWMGDINQDYPCPRKNLLLIRAVDLAVPGAAAKRKPPSVGTGGDFGRACGPIHLLVELWHCVS